MDARVNINPEVITAVQTLGTTLLNVTLAQVTGYWAKASKLITPEALAGVGAFSGLVSLPALLFRAVAVLDFSTVPVEIVAALFIGKVLMLVLSMTRSDAESRAHDEHALSLHFLFSPRPPITSPGIARHGVQSERSPRAASRETSSWLVVCSRCSSPTLMTWDLACP